MPKVKLLILVCLLILFTDSLTAQNYKVQYQLADTNTVVKGFVFQESFPSRIEAVAYLNTLSLELIKQGFVTASLDSIRIDSSSAYAQVFLGERYQWANIITNPLDEDLLSQVHWPRASFQNRLLDWGTVQSYQQQILETLENSGYPFAKIYLDSLQINGAQVSALLKINRGPIYKIDSIRLLGSAKISHDFLQRYLDLPNGSIYSKKKLEQVNKKLKELTYVEEEKPSSVSLQGTGSVLELYLKPKRSSQLNALVGFLPNSDVSSTKRFLVTGEANILLRNSLGAGETIGLNWQQLQLKSPRLNLLYDRPFLFKSPFGLNFNFDMFRKDSSFVNIHMQLGATYVNSGIQSASVFLQRRQSILNAVDTQLIMSAKRLPAQADVSSNNLGAGYVLNTTDYRFNPRAGNELTITASAGNKRIKKNNQVVSLKDPGFNYEQLYDTVKLNTYQFRVTGYAAHYFPAGKQATLKTALHGGIFQSGNYFINELFQIGGYKLLRGFTEESEYVSQYAIGTLEYRYLFGTNSNFFVFTDGGWAKNPIGAGVAHTYLGAGLGMSFETKAGIFNLAWAVGKRNDAKLNLRQSKIHFGFVNYF